MTKLNRCWKNCLRMWKWISENLSDGFTGLSWDEKKVVVNGLKAQWLQEHRFTREIDRDCFFCNYANTKRGCYDFCPGRLVDKQFHCNPPSGKDSYAGNPKGFYRRLLELDAKRTGKKKS